MFQILTQISTVNDVTFTLGNLITIGGGIIATLSAFFKLQYDQKGETKATIVRFETLEKELEKQCLISDEKILHVTNGKRAMKKDLVGMIEKEAETTKARIDKTQERLERSDIKNQAEFKEINGSLNKIIGLLESQKK